MNMFHHMVESDYRQRLDTFRARFRAAAPHEPVYVPFGLTTADTNRIIAEIRAERADAEARTTQSVEETLKNVRQAVADDRRSAHVKFSERLAKMLAGAARKITQNRQPDFFIGGEVNPYMKRWWIIPRNRFFNIYLHRFLRSDDDRALHDHPWLNVSFLIEGQYTEHTIEAGGVNKQALYTAGCVKFRRAKYAHRIELTDGPCWSLFITGPVIRDWGFHCPKGWRIWREFVSERDAGQVGRGCAD